MKSSLRYPLEGEVHVDEFFVGGQEEKKRLVVLALEKLPKGVGRAYARVIENASGKEFRPFFISHIDASANVITDVWNGYLPLKKEYINLQQIPSK